MCQRSVHVTNGGQCRGMMAPAGLELPYPRVSQAKFRDNTSRRESNVVVFVLLFYVHGKHLRSCRDGQLT